MKALAVENSSASLSSIQGEQKYFSRSIPQALAIELNQLLTTDSKRPGQEGFGFTGQMESRLVEIKNDWADFVDPYFALFKFYFRAGNYRQAEITVWQAAKLLSERQGFRLNYRLLKPETANWLKNDTDHRHFLFCLKALGVIRLRRQKVFLAKKVLTKLSELDPYDEIGGGNFLQIAESFYG